MLPNTLAAFENSPYTHTQLLGVGLIAGGSYLVATNNALQVFGGPLGAVGLSAIIIIVGIVVFLLAAVGILGGCFQHKLILGIVSHTVCVCVELSHPPPVSCGDGPSHHCRAGCCHCWHCQERGAGKSSLSPVCASYVLPLQAAIADNTVTTILDNYAENNKTDITAINFIQKSVSAHINLPPLMQLFPAVQMLWLERFH